MPTRAHDPKDPDSAGAILRAGGLCAFATETVYGLGADATNSDAVLKIYETKGRPRFNPLIVHCATVWMAKSLVEFDPLAEKLAAAFWPGPLTLVLPLRERSPISDIVTAGLKTLAVRVPDNEAARQMIGALGRPVAAPSANPSGKLSPTTAQTVRAAFKGRVPVLDGGPCARGIESTILGLVEGKPVQLRAGALPRAEIEAVLGRAVLAVVDADTVKAPGMLKSHYAPRAALRLNAETPEPGEAFLAFGDAPETEGPLRNLSLTGDLHEAARNLFSMLDALDAEDIDRIAVAPIPETGLGEAINDRLRRAAAPRS